MIRVTIWNENVQERMGVPGNEDVNTPGLPQSLLDQCAEMRRVQTDGAMHNTLRDMINEMPDAEVRHIATLEMPECGLTEDVLNDTDVLIWWSHIAHERVPDEIAMRVVSHVQRGMGFIPLHSSHLCKPFRYLMGTTGTLRWREGDFCRVWNTCPTHPIASGIGDYIELEEEEMYGEFFDIPKPDDIVFMSWYAGGELFRSGCTWTRGYGRIFYFQPGHETNRSYFNPQIRRIIHNAVQWCAEPEHRPEERICLPVAEPMKNTK